MGWWPEGQQVVRARLYGLQCVTLCGLSYNNARNSGQLRVLALAAGATHECVRKSLEF